MSAVSHTYKSTKVRAWVDRSAPLGSPLGYFIIAYRVLGYFEALTANLSLNGLKRALQCTH